MSAPAIIADLARPITRPVPGRVQEVYVAAVDAIPIGEGRAFHVGDYTIAVFRLRGGALRAMDNVCPHRGGPLSEGIVGAGTVLCPFHAWKFELATGDCHTEPCKIRTFTVREEHGAIYVRLPK
jgi:nitrite reductase (NADH) small subunit